MTHYTHAVWRAKPGREDAFVAAWHELAERTKASFPRAQGTLVRDVSDPTRFISFGPWADLEEIAAFRDSPAFREAAAAMRDLLESFEPGTYELVREVR